MGTVIGIIIGFIGGAVVSFLVTIMKVSDSMDDDEKD